MRYAIISDIHANPEALRSVLADAQDCGCERIICLGDIVGYGPDPVGALELVYKHAHICLAGNHDDAVCGRCSTELFSEFAASAVQRHRAELNHDALKWLRELPYEWSDGKIACAHGDFYDSKSFYYITKPEEAEYSWAARSEQLMFVGHTHEPCIFVVGPSGETHKLDAVDFQLEAKKRYIVNPGSVGYPRVGMCRSSYAIWDSRLRVVTFRSLPFDLEGYRQKMNGKGLEEAPWMVERGRELARPELRKSATFSKPRRKGVLLKTLGALALMGMLIAGVIALKTVLNDETTPPMSVQEGAKPSVVYKKMMHVTPTDKNVHLLVKPFETKSPVTVRIEFFDQEGRTVNQAYYSMKDKTNLARTPKVPKNAVKATLYIECDDKDVQIDESKIEWRPGR